jgi:surface antigen Omp85-like protein
LKIFVKIFLIVPVVLSSLLAKPQAVDSASKPAKFFSYDSLHQTDIVDLARSIFKKETPAQTDAGSTKSSGTHVSILPAVGYSLQTGFAAILSANIAFYNGAGKDQNISTIVTSFTYSQYKQYILPILTNIWSKNNKYNFQSEWRYLKYPSFTYGLGTKTTLADGYRIDYSYLRMHQTISRKLSKNLYGGIGIDLDYYWNIKELSPDSGIKTDFENYGLNPKETAVGPSVSLLYDSRGNSINPENGSYVNLSYRPKLKFMGSDANWQSLLLEFKGYKKFPARSGNIIALWSYNWFTFGGKPPYLLLPSTGWDANVNTGRGFIQGRYRGSSMLYLESEYRFLITSNGLFGGVIFANAETFSSRESTLEDRTSLKTFDPIQPGYGLGVRIKLNKFSRANLCVDYGWGSGGSKGVAVNLGEVF